MLGLEIFDKRDGFKVLLGYVGFLVLVVIIMEIVKFIHENKEKESRTGKIKKLHRFLQLHISLINNKLLISN